MNNERSHGEKYAWCVAFLVILTLSSLLVYDNYLKTLDRCAFCGDKMWEKPVEVWEPDNPVTFWVHPRCLSMVDRWIGIMQDKWYRKTGINAYDNDRWRAIYRFIEERQQGRL